MLLRKTINSILKVGTQDSASELVNFRVILVNSIAVLSILINSFYFITFILRLQLSYSILYFVGGTISLFCIYLNHHHKHKSAAWILLNTISIMIIVASVVSGYITQTHPILVIFATFAFLVSSNLKYSSLYVFGNILFYCLSYYYVDINGPMSPETKVPFSEFINFGLALVSASVFGRVLLIEVSDYINSLKDTLAELKIKNAEIEEKNNKLELFNAVAAHDLRTPVRNISSFIGLAKRKMDSDSEQYKVNEYLETAENSAKQMNALINSISDMSELNKSQLVDQEQVDLNDLMKDLIQQVILPRYPDTTILFKDLPLIYINKAHIHTVFQNLLLNGLKYNMRDQKEIRIQHKMSNKRLNVEITDNGIGIEFEYKTKIFEAFSKLHSGSEFEGTGMGLYIVQEILQRYNATIHVKDSSENGTTFEISFPSNVCCVKSVNQSKDSNTLLMNV